MEVLFVHCCTFGIGIVADYSCTDYNTAVEVMAD